MCIEWTGWVMWKKLNLKLCLSVLTSPLFAQKFLFSQTNQLFSQTCDVYTPIVSHMVGKLLTRSIFEDPPLYINGTNLKSYEFIPHAGICYMWDLTPPHNQSMRCYRILKNQKCQNDGMEISNMNYMVSKR